MHVREPEIAALESICELRMVDSHQVEHGRLQVVNRNGIHGNVVSDIVRLANVIPGLIPPPASHMVKARG